MDDQLDATAIVAVGDVAGIGRLRDEAHAAVLVDGRGDLGVDAVAALDHGELVAVDGLDDLRTKTRKGDEQNKPLLNQVNYVLLHLHLAGKHDAKPSHEELKDWLHSGQVDVLRMTKK